jgi:Kdo2-lipid IVA lauroyltransferase/acyltransferase
MLAALVRIIGYLPPRALAALGRGIGALAFHIATSRRRICLRNLTICFPKLPAAQITQRAKDHFRAYGQAMFEHAFLWHGRKDSIRKYVHFVDEHHWLEHKDKRPVITQPHRCTAHKAMPTSMQ